MAQTFCNEIIISYKNLLQDPQHQWISKLFQSIDNFIQPDLSGCQFEPKCDMDFLFHHDLFLFGFLAK